MERLVAVKITDYSEYEGGQCNTSGKYSYTTHYYRVGYDEWEVEYSTSADFKYCPICGSFGDCGCEEYGCTPLVVTTETVLKDVLRVQGDANYEVGGFTDDVEFED